MEATSDEAPEAWRERIAAQQAGGLSIRAWCRENSQREHTFYWWRSRLGLSPKPPNKHRRRRIVQAGFAELVVDPSLRPVSVSEPRPVGGSAVEPIRLRLHGGRELVLSASMTDERLAALVHRIEGAHDWQ
jgi:hypothetical protein